MNKDIHYFRLAVIMAMVSGFSVQAHAALSNRGTDSLGNRLIYDSDLNITWYDFTNWNVTWWGQMNWAAGLSVNFGGNVYDDWRLPLTVDGPYVYGYNGTTTAGYNITSSEMGHLFYTELGNKGYCSTSGYCPQAGWGLKNEGSFTHLDPVGYYWSSTEYAATPGNAWFFNFYTGAQQLGGTGTYTGIGSLAVRPGDVAVIPEPINSILFITGGATPAVRSYMKRKKQ